MIIILTSLILFFMHGTPPILFYTLSLHDALPILFRLSSNGSQTSLKWIAPNSARVDQAGLQIPIHAGFLAVSFPVRPVRSEEHTSNSSHSSISYAVFCLKKKTT